MKKRKKRPFILTNNHCKHCRNLKDMCTCPKDEFGQVNTEKHNLDVKSLDFRKKLVL